MNSLLLSLLILCSEGKLTCIPLYNTLYICQRSIEDPIGTIKYKGNGNRLTVSFGIQCHKPI